MKPLERRALFSQAYVLLNPEDGRPLLVRAKAKPGLTGYLFTGALGRGGLQVSEISLTEKFYGLNSQLPTYLSAIKDFQAADLAKAQCRWWIAWCPSQGYQGRSMMLSSRSKPSNRAFSWQIRPANWGELWEKQDCARVRGLDHNSCSVPISVKKQQREFCLSLRLTY